MNFGNIYKNWVYSLTLLNSYVLDESMNDIYFLKYALDDTHHWNYFVLFNETEVHCRAENRKMSIKE